ncbi:MAG: nucleoside hydrolase [Planctomycetes bacterium]|nr:nucleoside hydrolase [Planctomycetota bacterium]
MAIKLVVDTDPGIDDALAIALSFNSPEVKVHALTAAGGNLPAEECLKNIYRILGFLGVRDKPLIGVGRDWPRSGEDARHIHGKDGLANTYLPVFSRNAAEPAAKLIASILTGSPEPVTLLALAPLTSVADTIDRIGTAEGNVERVVIMGGAFHVPGNASPTAEFNIYHNPEAARLVINSPLPIVIVPLDITTGLVFTVRDFDAFSRCRTGAGKLARNLLPFYLQAHRRYLGLDGVHLHDVVATAFVMAPEIFETKKAWCDVEIEGEITRGTTVIDDRPISPKAPNVEVVTGFDAEALKNFILSRLSRE